MVNIKYAFLKLSKKIKFTIIAILQLAITFAFLYNIIYINNEVSKTTKKVTQIFQKPNIYIIDPFYNIDDILQGKHKDFRKFHEYLKNNDKFDHCTVSEDHLLINKFKGYKNFLLTNNYAPKKEGDKYFPIKTLKIDYNYLKNFGYKIIDGKNLTSKDFNKDRKEIPILLGYNYKEVFKVNDKINYYDYDLGKKTLTVKGFIDKGYSYVGKNINQHNIKSLDNYIIYPLSEPIEIKGNKEDEEVMIMNEILESFTIISSNNKEEVIDEIQHKASEDFGDVKIYTVDDEINDFLQQYKIEETIVGAIFFITIVMCSIGIITNMITSIKNSYKEIAIHLLNGATMKDMFLRIFYEMLIITLLSLSLSIAGIKILSEFEMVEINIIYIFQLILLALIIMSVILIIPILYIKKVSINELLRESYIC